jgi:hypothetical protein
MARRSPSYGMIRSSTLLSASSVYRSGLHPVDDDRGHRPQLLQRGVRLAFSISRRSELLRSIRPPLSPDLDDRFHESCHNEGFTRFFLLLYRSRVPEMERSEGHGGVAAGD